MAKVLFINPVIREEDDPRHVPYGIALLASILTREGHLVQVYDANAWRASDSVLAQVLKADRWDVIALGGITTAYRSIKHIVTLAKQVVPQALVVAGGGFLTSMPHDIMRFLPQLDVGVVGEAFVSFPALLHRLDAGNRDWAAVPGLVWRDNAAVSHLTPEQPLLDDIDTLPYPSWDLFPLEVYFKNSMALFSEEGMLARRRLDINASYGCSLICRFCFHLGIAGDMEQVQRDGRADVAFGYKRVIRYHSPRYVVDLVKHARARFGIDFVGFLDENLMTMHQFSGKTWLTDIARLWIEEGLQPQCVRDGVEHDPDRCEGVHWGGTSHATLCSPEVLRTIKQAGCSHLVYGYESFSARVMKTIGKGATPETNERSLRWTLDAGIRPIPNQMIGFPDEDFDSLRDNVHAWNRLGLQVKPFFATPYPGTEWYQKYKDRILEQYDGDLEAFLLDVGDATRVTAVISKKFNAVELYGLRELMVLRDLNRIARYEDEWNRLHPVDPLAEEKKAWLARFDRRTPAVAHS
ncbi:MAG: B12-binding domain-containing radical SAM protein [Acidobacteria bacterium]|nr:MAG: B12-binding domain-containing radical SAM protein [Acidobacteriota bacterium]